MVTHLHGRIEGKNSGEKMTMSRAACNGYADWCAASINSPPTSGPAKAYFFMTGLIEHRTEERRVGKVCVSTCRSRWSPDHEKKDDIIDDRQYGDKVYINT